MQIDETYVFMVPLGADGAFQMISHQHNNRTHLQRFPFRVKANVRRRGGPFKCSSLSQSKHKQIFSGSVLSHANPCPSVKLERGAVLRLPAATSLLLAALIAFQTSQSRLKTQWVQKYQLGSRKHPILVCGHKRVRFQESANYRSG